MGLWRSGGQLVIVLPSIAGRQTAALRPNAGRSEYDLSLLKSAVRSGNDWMAQFGINLPLITCPNGGLCGVPSG